MSARSERAVALPLEARQSDDEWPGVVCRIGGDWRLIVAGDAERYVLQVREDTADGPLWYTAGGKCPYTVAKIDAKFGRSVPGLSDVLRRLPERARDALPAFAEAVAARDALLRRGQPWAPDYRRVLAVADAAGERWRLAVSADGRSYLLQMDDGWRWSTALSGQSLRALAAQLWRWQAERFAYAEDAERAAALVPALLGLLSDDLPREARAGHWPELLPPPAFAVQRSREAARRADRPGRRAERAAKPRRGAEAPPGRQP